MPRKTFFTDLLYKFFVVNINLFFTQSELGCQTSDYLVFHDKSLLNIRIFGGQSSSNTARHAYSQEQEDDNSDSYTGSSGCVVNDELFKLDETSGLVDFVCTSSSSFTTAFCKDFAASVGNVIALVESRCSFPISVIVDTTTSEIALHDVPSFGHSFVGWLFVIFQTFCHCCGDNFSGVTPKEVDCNGDSDQRQQNQGQHSSVGVHHTGIFRASSATAEEGDDKHESADDDQNDRGVEIGVAQKVQVLGHVDLDVSTNANESHTRQEEDEIEKKDNVFDENVATTHLGSF